MLTGNAQTTRVQRTALDHCSECNQPLALLTPLAAPMVSPWVCDQCGAAYLADRPAEEDRAHEPGARQVPFELLM